MLVFAQVGKQKRPADQRLAGLHFFASITRGPERIRTAVGAFAELCLATRPQDRIDLRFNIYYLIFLNLKAGKYTFFSCLRY